MKILGKHHIITVCDKVAKVIGILHKSRRYLPSHTLKTLYNSLFLPYINYCNLIWGSTFVSYLKPLYILQKKAIGIITFSLPLTHTKKKKTFFLSWIFFRSIYSTNSMYPVLFSHISIALCLPLFLRFYISIVSFMIIQLALVLTYTNSRIGINLLFVPKPRLFGMISLWLSITALPLLTSKRSSNCTSWTWIKFLATKIEYYTEPLIYPDYSLLLRLIYCSL